ncbi:MAG TPA: response regulator [Polyangiaceae bacterium]|nr:response regulator [Polyangiaceae bacterium]
MTARKTTNSIRPGLHVLIVDDDPNVLRDVSTRLNRENHRVSVFSRASGVRQLVRVLKPQVVLIDVLMPDMNKRILLELLSACRRSEEQPIVILHSRLSVRMLKTLVNVGNAAGVIQKTKSDIEFMLAFNAIVERARAPHARFLSPSSTSGTHRIPTLADEDVEELRTGSTR